MRKSKRHFLLLEVMIALGIVTLCIIPMLRPHLYMLTEEKSFLREVELDRLVGVLYADLLVEGFYRGTIPWRVIEDGESINIDNDFLTSLGFKGSYSFAIERKKGKLADNLYAFNLLEVIYSFVPIGGGTPLVYSYELFVQRTQEAAEKGEEGPANG